MARIFIVNPEEKSFAMIAVLESTNIGIMYDFKLVIIVSGHYFRSGRLETM